MHKPDDRTAICKHCRFYDEFDVVCRKRSPVVAESEHAVWPKVIDIDWCDDHKYPSELESLWLEKDPHIPIAEFIEKERL